jgi:hypothetical protein
LSPEKDLDTPIWPQEDLIALTVPEVRHLRWNLVWIEPMSVDHLLAWSQWRRQHQVRAKRCHCQRHEPAAKTAAVVLKSRIWYQSQFE